MKLTKEQHAEIAKHLQAADNHLLKVLNVLCNRNGTTNVPVDIVADIENVRNVVGATSSASPNSEISILSRCEKVLACDWPSWTFDTYHGSYADCATLALEGPYGPPED